jgi:hypothetical protein
MRLANGSERRDFLVPHFARRGFEPQLVQLPDQRAIAMSAAATAPKQTFQGSGSIGLRRTSCVIDLAAMSHFGRAPRRRESSVEEDSTRRIVD